MKIRRHETNCATGEVREFEEDVPDGTHLTVEQGMEETRLQSIRDNNAAIQAQLAAADLTIIRAIVEGDTQRIKAHRDAQDKLRAKIKPVV